MIINLLSSPRNVSTALMYSFAQRPDTRIIDEPFYGYYLREVSKIIHPGHQEIIDSMESSFDKAMEMIEQQALNTDLLFLKNMAHHLDIDQLAYLSDCRHIIFIREPKEIIHSFSKVIPNPTLRDIGVQMHLNMFQALREEGHHPLVLDAKELLMNPRATLRLLCDFLDVPFFESMLSWPSEPRAEDGEWAKYWYHNVHKSTGFKTYEKKEINLTSSMEALYQEALPYYLELRKHSINAPEIR